MFGEVENGFEYVVGISGNSTFEYDIGNWNWGDSQLSAIIDKKYDLILDSRTTKRTYILNDEVIYEDNTTISSGKSTINAMLFSRTNGYTNFFSKIKLYSTKIYDNGIIIRQFIPCYRINDNEVGLYDLVNDVFYANSGTETFEKGNDI